ncbi:MAG: hypothetical protein AAF483_26970, partial [Planctomycetota bacterium]
MNDEASPRRLTAIHYACILAVATTAVWVSGISSEFVWIDHVEIEQAGYRIQSWDDFRRVWSQSLDSYIERNSGEQTAAGGYYRPLYAVFLSTAWLCFGDSPLPYHVLNIFLHIFVVLGLYFLG